MNRAHKDFALAHLAAEIGERAIFPDPTGEILNRLKQTTIRGFAYRGCQTALPWIHIRFTIAGAQRTIAKFPVNRQLDAVRFADAAILHFWKYRRTSFPCVDADTTLGIALASDVPKLVLDYLVEIEDHLRRRGYFSESPTGQLVRDPDAVPMIAALKARKALQVAASLIHKLAALDPSKDFSSTLQLIASTKDSLASDLCQPDQKTS